MDGCYGREPYQRRKRNYSDQFNIILPSDLLKNRIEEGKSIDLSESDPTIRMCLETITKNIVRIDSNCIEIIKNVSYQDLVQADLDEAFASAKEALLQQLDDASVSESIEWWQKAWETSKSSIETLENK